MRSRITLPALVVGLLGLVGCAGEGPDPKAGSPAVETPAPKDSGAGKAAAGPGRLPGRK